MVVPILLGVGEFLRPEDLKFPILFDQREDTDGVAGDCGTINGSAHCRDLQSRLRE